MSSERKAEQKVDRDSKDDVSVLARSTKAELLMLLMLLRPDVTPTPFSSPRRPK